VLLFDNMAYRRSALFQDTSQQTFR